MNDGRFLSIKAALSTTPTFVIINPPIQLNILQCRAAPKHPPPKLRVFKFLIFTGELRRLQHHREKINLLCAFTSIIS